MLPDGFKNEKNRYFLRTLVYVPLLIGFSLYVIFSSASRWSIDILLFRIFLFIMGIILMVFAFSLLFIIIISMRNTEGRIEKEYRLNEGWIPIRNVVQEKIKRRAKYGFLGGDGQYNFDAVKEIEKILENNHLKYNYWENKSQVPVLYFLPYFEAFIIDINNLQLLIGLRDVTRIMKNRIVAVSIGPVVKENKPLIEKLSNEINNAFASSRQNLNRKTGVD
jgi:hypothetical protein